MNLPITPATREELLQLEKIQRLLAQGTSKLSKLPKARASSTVLTVIESLEICLNELGFLLQQRELTEYSALIHKIFVSWKLIFRFVFKAQNEAAFSDDQPLEFLIKHKLDEKQQLKSKTMEKPVIGLFGGSKIMNYSNLDNLTTEQSQIAKMDTLSSPVNNKRASLSKFPQLNLTGRMTTFGSVTERQEFLMQKTDFTQNYQLEEYQENILQQVLKQSSKLDVQIQMKRYDPKIKLFLSQATDTNQDAIDAMKAFSKFSDQQEGQLNKIIEEKDENILELQKALKMKGDILNKECSGASEKLKSIHKQLLKKTLDFEMAFAEAQKHEEGVIGNQMGEFVDYVQHCYKDIQTETYQAVLRVFNEMIKKKKQTKNEQLSLDSAPHSLEKNTKHRQKDSKQVNNSAFQENGKLKQDLNQKNQELDSKYEEIQTLNQKLKELKDLTLNSDAEIDFLRGFQFRLEQDKTKLQIEIRRLEKFLSKDTQEIGVQVNEINLQDQQLIQQQQQKIDQYYYENQALNQKLQFLQDQYSRLQEQIYISNSQSPYQQSQNKSGSPDQRFFNQKKTAKENSRKEKFQKNFQSERELLHQGSIGNKSGPRTQIDFTDEDPVEDVESQVSLDKYQKAKIKKAQTSNILELEKIRQKSKTPQNQIQLQQGGKQQYNVPQRKQHKSPTQQVVPQIIREENQLRKSQSIIINEINEDGQYLKQAQQNTIVIKEEMDENMLNSQNSVLDSARKPKNPLQIDQSQENIDDSTDKRQKTQIVYSNKGTIQKQSSFANSILQSQRSLDQLNNILEQNEQDELKQLDHSIEEKNQVNKNQQEDAQLTENLVSDQFVQGNDTEGTHNTHNIDRSRQGSQKTNAQSSANKTQRAQDSQFAQMEKNNHLISSNRKSNNCKLSLLLILSSFLQQGGPNQ